MVEHPVRDGDGDKMPPVGIGGAQGTGGVQGAGARRANGEGEREIARIAFEKGLKVITLANKGFSPLYKPGGRLFSATAAGNLLMLAPIALPPKR